MRRHRRSGIRMKCAARRGRVRRATSLPWPTDTHPRGRLHRYLSTPHAAASHHCALPFLHYSFIRSNSIYVVHFTKQCMIPNNVKYKCVSSYYSNDQYHYYNYCLWERKSYLFIVDIIHLKSLCNHDIYIKRILSKSWPADGNLEVAISLLLC